MSPGDMVLYKHKDDHENKWGALGLVVMHKDHKIVMFWFWAPYRFDRAIQSYTTYDERDKRFWNMCTTFKANDG